MTHHVFAVPVTEDTVETPILIDASASTMDEAVAAVTAAGYTVIADDDGGNFDLYDAADAPGIYGFEADGKGAFGITVVAVND